MSEYFGVTTDYILKGIEPIKEEIILKTGDCYKEGIQHVLTCLASGEESFISGTEAVKSLQMALAIRSNMQRI